MTLSGRHGCTTPAWLFIQSAPRQNLRAVSAIKSLESLLRIRKFERTVLGYQGTVNVVDVLGALAVGEQGVGGHDSAAVHDETNLVLEGAVQPLGGVGERLHEQLAHERNVLHAFQARNSATRCCWNGQQPRYGHMHTMARNRCRCLYGHEVGEGRKHHFATHP